jgi:cell division septal protein FtsQ
MTTDAPANVPLVRTEQRKRWGLWLFVPLSLSMIFLVVVANQWRETLKMDRIIVEGATILQVKDVVALAQAQPRTRVSQIDLYEVRKRLLRQPFIRAATVNRLYPGTISIRIEERRPIGLLSAGQMRYVDAEGMVLPYVSSAVTVDLPAISGVDGAQNAEVGKIFRQKDLAEAITILETAQEVDSAVYHFISEVNMQNGRDVILYSSDVVVQIYLGRGDVARKLVTLQAFWSAFAKTSDVENVESLDLRYEDQVVVKWNKQAAAGATRATL